MQIDDLLCAFDLAQHLAREALYIGDSDGRNGPQ